LRLPAAGNHRFAPRPRPPANRVQDRARPAFACIRLKRCFCFNIAPLPLSRFALIDASFFELAFLDGFIN
jgi:hypothetical protein